MATGPGMAEMSVAVRAIRSFFICCTTPVLAPLHTTLLSPAANDLLESRSIVNFRARCVRPPCAWRRSRGSGR